MRAKRGFTFTETLVSLLIIVLLTALVASCIPVAINAYKQVMNASNAQMALSTTTSALRNELGLAVDVKVAANGSLYYQTGEGDWVRIDNGSVGLVKHVYKDAIGGFKPDTPGTEIDAVSLVPDEAIEGASNDEPLRVSMGGASGASITYDASSGVFTVHGIQVTSGSTQVEGVDDYKVRAIVEPGSR